MKKNCVSDQKTGHAGRGACRVAALHRGGQSLARSFFIYARRRRSISKPKPPRSDSEAGSGTTVYVASTEPGTVAES